MTKERIHCWLQRCYSTLLDNPKVRVTSNPHPIPSKPPTFLPIPHRSIPDPLGQDYDFVTVACSHLIHADWARLDAMASGLNSFRMTHILLRIRKDPVLSLEFFDWVGKTDSSSVNLETSCMVLHVLSKAKRFRAAEALLKDKVIPKSKNSSAEIFDAVLYSYRLCDSSPRVFDSLFKTYAHLRKFRDTTEIYRRMRDYGFFPTIKSCNAYLSSLLDFKRADILLSFYKEMRRSRISPNVYTLNMVLSCLCDSNKLDKATELFEQMEMLGCSPTVSTFNTLIAGHCRSGFVEPAIKLKNMMRKKGLHPNVVTYNTLIHGYCKDGKLQDANRIFNEMKTVRVDPNTITYNTLINGYSMITNTEMAFRLHEEMLTSGIKSDTLTYNALIYCLCNEGKMKKAAYLVKELDKHNLEPNASTFNALLMGQCKMKNSERAFQIYNAMKKCGYHPQANASEVLISAFCANKDFDGALEVVRNMLEGWTTPNEALLVDLFEGIYRYGTPKLTANLDSVFKGRKIFIDCLKKAQLLVNQHES